jgi:hypothetical protein
MGLEVSVAVFIAALDVARHRCLEIGARQSVMSSFGQDIGGLMR